jgi:hypothetical protein
LEYLEHQDWSSLSRASLMASAPPTSPLGALMGASSPWHGRSKGVVALGEACPEHAHAQVLLEQLAEVRGELEAQVEEERALQAALA